MVYQNYSIKQKVEEHQCLMHNCNVNNANWRALQAIQSYWVLLLHGRGLLILESKEGLIIDQNFISNAYIPPLLVSLHERQDRLIFDLKTWKIRKHTCWYQQCWKDWQLYSSSDFFSSGVCSFLLDLHRPFDRCHHLRGRRGSLEAERRRRRSLGFRHRASRHRPLRMHGQLGLVLRLWHRFFPSGMETMDKGSRSDFVPIKSERQKKCKKVAWSGRGSAGKEQRRKGLTKAVSGRKAEICAPL